MITFFKFFSIIILILFFKYNVAQDNVLNTSRLKFLNFETGIDFMDSKIPEFDFIRGDINSWGDGSSTDHLSGYFQKLYFGAGTEIRTKNNRFGLISGLHFSRINSSLGKESYWYENNDYYYVLLSLEETTIQFLRVEEVNNSMNYLGIPVEVRILPFLHRKFNLYFKAGIEFNYLLNNYSDVIFQDESMNIYKDEIVSKFDSPSRFFLSGHAAIGFNISIKNIAYLNIETNIPSAVLSEYSSGVVNPDVGGGFRLLVQIPF